MSFKKKQLLQWEKSLIKKYPEMFDDDFKKFGFETGFGWKEIIKTCCDQLWSIYLDLYKQFGDKIEPPKILHVKEKFGGLRFYYSGDSRISDQFEGVVSFVEKLSFTVCESCGRPGKRREDKPWVRTLCDYCAYKTNHNIKVRSYKPIEEQLRIQLLNHSGMWRIVSNALGSKSRAQDELNRIIDSLHDRNE